MQVEKVFSLNLMQTHKVQGVSLLDDTWKKIKIKMQENFKDISLSCENFKDIILTYENFKDISLTWQNFKDISLTWENFKDISLTWQSWGMYKGVMISKQGLVNYWRK